MKEGDHTIAIIGDTPEALLLSILYADAGLPNCLVGPFGDDGRTHTNRPGIEEALWLLGIFSRSGKIQLASNCDQIPTSNIRTVILADHVSDANKSNHIELTIRRVAPRLSPGSSVVFAGLCRPRFFSTVFRPLIEKHAGMKIGADLALYYLPVFWSGERLQDFREKPKLVAAEHNTNSETFQKELLRVFPTLTIAPTIELAETSALFSAIGRDVRRALELELASISEMHRINFDDVLDLCKITGSIALSDSSSQNDSIGTGIALGISELKTSPRLVRAAHSINEDYQSHIVQMIKAALNQCGYAFRRSKIAILGTDGLLKNPWSRLESPPIIEALRRRGAQVSLYPAENGTQPWVRIVGERARVENNLLRAVAKAYCTVIALPRSAASEVDADQLASEMNRPGAICDLTRVLEASNVERTGLFYTAIGRGPLNT